MSPTHWFLSLARQCASPFGIPGAAGAGRLAAWVACIALVLPAARANAQAVDTTLSVANGVVRAVVRSGNSVYFGGSFTTVGPPTGGGVPVSATTGVPVGYYPKVAGAVFAVVSDDAGGWYIGGSFDAVGRQPCSNLAHILADGSVGPWTGGTHGAVTALTLSGNKLYAYGYFDSVNGQPRNRIAAVNATTGALDSWDPHLDQTLYSLVASGGAVYLSGLFTQAGGQPRAGLAAVDTLDGTATSWDPSPDGQSYGLAVSGGVLYVGGAFTSVGGQPRNGLAAFDLSSGMVTGWDAHPSDADIVLLAAAGNIVCVGGSFSGIGGAIRPGFAVLDASTATATALDGYSAPPIFATDGVTIFAGGLGAPSFALDAQTGVPTAWNPQTSENVLAIAVSENIVYVGGTLATLGGAARLDLAALDATTGAVRSWDPHIDQIGQRGIDALATHGNNLYVAGNITSIGGEADTGLVAVDLTTGLVAPWTPQPNGIVHALSIVGDTLYVGGTFTRIGGQPRKGVAAFDLSTGALTSWQQTAVGSVNRLAADRSHVYAGGGAGLVALDATTGAMSWVTSVPGIIEALALDGNTLYAGGTYAGIGGQPRAGLAALNATTGVVLPWNPSSAAEVRALAVSDGLVYVGGGFAEMGGQLRSNFATLDEVSGLAVDSNLGLDGDGEQFPDGTGSYHGTVDAVDLVGTSLYLGGEFTSVEGWPSVAVAGFSIDATTSTMVSLASSSASNGRVLLEWYSAGAVDHATVYRRTMTSAWSAIGAVVADGRGMLDYADTDVVPGARYGYRLGAIVNGTEQWLGEAWVDVPRAATFALAGARPNPTFAGLRVAFSLPDASPARIDVLDVQGRLVLEREVGSLGPGSHVVNLVSGRMPHAGLYFLRLTSGKHSEMGRVIVGQ